MSDQIIVQHPHKLEQTITKYIVQTDKIYRIISIFFQFLKKENYKNQYYFETWYYFENNTRTT